MKGADGKIKGLMRSECALGRSSSRRRRNQK